MRDFSCQNCQYEKKSCIVNQECHRPVRYSDTFPKQNAGIRGKAPEKIYNITSYKVKEFINSYEYRRFVSVF